MAPRPPYNFLFGYLRQVAHTISINQMVVLPLDFIEMERERKGGREREKRQQ